MSIHENQAGRPPLHYAIEQLSGMQYPPHVLPPFGGIELPQIIYGKPVHETRTVIIVPGGKVTREVGTGVIDVDEPPVVRALTSEEDVLYEQGRPIPGVETMEEHDARVGQYRPGSAPIRPYLLVQRQDALYTELPRSDVYPRGALVIPVEISSDGLRRVIALAARSYNSGYDGSDNRNRQRKADNHRRQLVGELLSKLTLSQVAGVNPTWGWQSYHEAGKPVVGNRWEPIEGVAQPDMLSAKVYQSYPELTAEQIGDIQVAHERGLPLSYSGDQPYEHQRCYVLSPDGSDRDSDVQRGSTKEWYAIRPDDVALSFWHKRGEPRTAWSDISYAHCPEELTEQQSARLVEIRRQLWELRGGTGAPPDEKQDEVPEASDIAEEYEITRDELMQRILSNERLGELFPMWTQQNAVVTIARLVSSKGYVTRKPEGFVDEREEIPITAQHHVTLEVLAAVAGKERMRLRLVENA